MPRSNVLRLCALASLVAGACGPSTASSRTEAASFDLDATRQIIGQQNVLFTQAHLKGDVALIDSMFTPDAKCYPPGSPMLTGVSALHNYTVEFLKLGLTEFREETKDFYGNEQFVVDGGSYVATYGPDHVTERGKYLNVWKKVNGRWKIQSNIWNSDAPEPKATS